MTDELFTKLTEAERKHIREEMRYALTVLQEGKIIDQRKNFLDKLFSYLSNGFVILLVGSLITSFLVPRFQRQYENKKQKNDLMQRCFSEYLLYTNSIWREYYSIFPLIHTSEINKGEYIEYLNKISEIKLKRYDAFAKVQALTVIFRDETSAQQSDVEKTLYDYAVQVNIISESIDTWLRNLYCSPNKCLDGDHAPPVDQSFSPYNSFINLQYSLQRILKDGDKVAELMVHHMKSLK